MKLSQILKPNLWKMLLTLVFIVIYLIANSLLTARTCNISEPECITGNYHYNSPNFFSKHCGDCISFSGFVIDLIVYLLIQFILPYLLSCLVLIGFNKPENLVYQIDKKRLKRKK